MSSSSTGLKAFVLTARYLSLPKNATRRILGEYGAPTMEQARVKAREWLTLLSKGTDSKERMKGAHGAYIVPFAPDTPTLFKPLPRFNGWDFLFSTSDGRKAVNGFSKAKNRVDILSNEAVWKFHDLRRSTRAHLSDLHSYLDEKRESLALWEQRLRGILATNVPTEFVDSKLPRMRDK